MAGQRLPGLVHTGASPMRPSHAPFRSLAHRPPALPLARSLALATGDAQLSWQSPDAMRAGFVARSAELRAHFDAGGGAASAALAGVAVACALPTLTESADAGAWGFGERSGAERAALLGWTAHGASTRVKPSLHCAMCQRTVGLWNFAASAASAGAGGDGGDGAASAPTPFDPVAEHRSWCPWVAKVARFDGAVGAPTPPGWTLLLGHLRADSGAAGGGGASGEPTPHSSTEQYHRMKHLLASSVL